MARQTTLRRIAIAAVAGTSVALVCDCLLQVALSAIDPSAPSGRQVAARALARSVWVVASALTWLAAPILAARFDHDDDASDDAMPWSTATRLVGLALIAGPALWLIATWVVIAARITVGGHWAIDGRVFLEPGYYSALLVDNGPWLLAGAALLAWARHVRLSPHGE